LSIVEAGAIDAKISITATTSRARAFHHLRLPCHPDIGERAIIEPSQRLMLAHTRTPRCHQRAGSLAELHDLIP
jgi:hypothetical protein